MERALDRFEQLVLQLGLSGPQAEQARSLCIRLFDEQTLELVLPRELSYLLSDGSRQNLLDRLSGVLTDVRISLVDGERCSPTLGERLQERRAAQAAQLLKTMETDPMVLTLQREFGARLLPETLVVQAPGSMQ